MQALGDALSFLKLLKMNCHMLRSSSQALYHVFVRPSLCLQSPTSAARKAIASPFIIPFSIPQARYASRNVKFVPNGNEPYGIRDESIRSRVISLRDEHGTFHPNVYLKSVLANIDRATQRVVLLKPANPNDPESLPVCAIMTADEIAAQKKKMKMEEKVRARKKRLLDPKQLEINWGTDKNDLETKMKRMVDFLQQGRRVEILLAPKKRRAQSWTQGEAADLVSGIKNKALQVDGTKEYKKPDGKLGARLMLYYEGKELAKSDVEDLQTTSA